MGAGEHFSRPLLKSVKGPGQKGLPKHTLETGLRQGLDVDDNEHQAPCLVNSSRRRAEKTVSNTVAALLSVDRVLTNIRNLRPVLGESCRKRPETASRREKCTPDHTSAARFTPFIIGDGPEAWTVTSPLDKANYEFFLRNVSKSAWRC
jgi:hypothetical protein